MKRMILWAGLLSAGSAGAQLTDDFSDGNFTHSPAWTGSMQAWTVNAEGQVQSTHGTPNSSFYLSTPLSAAGATEWTITLRLGFNPSSTNYLDIYLRSSGSELGGTGTTAYLVRVGGTSDEVSLYRRDAGGSLHLLIDGTDGLTDRSDNPLRIRVVRTAAQQFHLFADPTGTGLNFLPQGSATETAYPSGGHFGVLARQSTSSFFGKHYFDEVRVQPFLSDTLAPVLTDIKPISANQLDLRFSEAVHRADAENESNYTIVGWGHPMLALVDDADASLVHLTINGTFTAGANYTLGTGQVRDYWGNAHPTSRSFQWNPVLRFDVVIHEVMAQPAPVQGLPDVEWIEIRNRSPRPVDLAGWRLTCGTTRSAPFPPFTLGPDSCLALAGTSGAPLLQPFATVLAVPSFPSLPNSGAILTLTGRDGTTIHALEYSAQWYGGGARASGGWSLEMIDRHRPCTAGENWTASVSPAGGTPGRTNSVAGTRPDSTAPRLLRSFAPDSTRLLLFFDEPLDSIEASQHSRYRLEPLVPIHSATPQPPLFRTVLLTLAVPLESGKTYVLRAAGIPDCAGNRLALQEVPAGRAEAPLPLDLIINEVLFNPRPNGADYVELFNRSERILDLRDVYLANRSGTGTLTNTTALSREALALFPGDYFVVTEDLPALRRDYILREPAAIWTLPALPTLPDDSGRLVLTTPVGVIDELGYSAKWHFPLLSDPEGVALERSDPDGATGSKDNWHSAAAAAGYGTPGYRNSQHRTKAAEGVLVLSPKTFSPDNDGRDDQLFIDARFSSPGFVVNITIFSEGGQAVRRLVRNALAGSSNIWSWNGLDERNRPLPVGAYVVLVEAFTMEGKRNRWKELVVLARPLN